MHIVLLYYHCKKQMPRYRWFFCDDISQDPDPQLGLWDYWFTFMNFSRKLSAVLPTFLSSPSVVQELLPWILDAVNKFKVPLLFSYFSSDFPPSFVLLVSSCNEYQMLPETLFLRYITGTVPTQHTALYSIYIFT